MHSYLELVTGQERQETTPIYVSMDKQHHRLKGAGENDQNNRSSKTKENNARARFPQQLRNRKSKKFAQPFVFIVRTREHYKTGNICFCRVRTGRNLQVVVGLDGVPANQGWRDIAFLPRGSRLSTAPVDMRATAFSLGIPFPVDVEKQPTIYRRKKIGAGEHEGKTKEGKETA